MPTFTIISKIDLIENFGPSEFPLDFFLGGD